MVAYLHRHTLLLYVRVISQSDEPDSTFSTLPDIPKCQSQSSRHRLKLENAKYKYKNNYEI